MYFNKSKKNLYALGRKKVGFRNDTELSYEKRLQLLLNAGEILWFKFESLKLRLADNTFYSPDFFVMNKNGELEAHEVKGAAAIFADDAKVKVKVASSIYPFKFFVAIPNRKSVTGWDIKEY